MSRSKMSACSDIPLLTVVLKDSDFDIVYEQLFSARIDWHNIGLNLKLDVDTLSNIEEKYRGDSEKALRSMLKKWFENDPEPTWEKLCNSLCSCIVSRNVLAGKIQKFVKEQERKPKTKTNRKRSPPTRSTSSSKRPKTIKPGKIESDLTLNDVSKELGEKWMEVGMALGIEYSDLRHTIEDDPKIPHARKPMEMLQKWKCLARDAFTYETLAAALKRVDLHTCAQTYCYQ